MSQLEFCTFVKILCLITEENTMVQNANILVQHVGQQTNEYLMEPQLPVNWKMCPKIVINVISPLSSPIYLTSTTGKPLLSLWVTMHNETKILPWSFYKFVPEN